MSKRIALFPGTFDPFTKGHLDLVQRGQHLFDKLIIAVGVNTNKNRLVNSELMEEKISSVTSNMPNVEVTTYDGLTADFAKKVGANFILRGVRNSTDLNYETPIAQVNKNLNSELETVFLISNPELSYISSSIVRDLIKYDKDVSDYLPYSL